MITAIKADNVEAYKLLFEEASDVLSGYERVQTYEDGKDYYYKTIDKTYEPFTFSDSAETETDRLVEFANGLVTYNVLYTRIIDENGEWRKADGFTPQLGITTLEEYYNWLPELKKDKEGKPTKYTILPLLNKEVGKGSGEDPFVINANTRAISIPSEFKKNGIAVQGDDLAEVVYFEVDRYFDAVDLNNCQIFIQWETPKGADGKVIKSISDIYLRDIESKPGKLIFGWAISDAITANAGNLKFSVKFLQWDENDKKSIAYSLNTLTATVAIHQSIGIDLEKDTYKPDNANNRLLDRIQESEVVGGLQAAKPYFVEDISEMSDGFDTVPVEKEFKKLYAVAKADDTGFVTYTWKKKTLNANNTINTEAGEQEILGTTTEMVQVTEVAEWINEEDGTFYPALKEGHVYYLDAEVDKPYKGGVTLEALKNAYPDGNGIHKFYERKAVLEVKEAGVYTVEARNRIFNSISKTRSRSAWFKRPEPVRIDNSKESSFGHIIGETSANLKPPHDEQAIGELSYQWYKAVESNLLSEDFKFLDLPIGGAVSYTESSARILCPTDPSVYYEQKVGEGGSKDRFYITMRCYAPEGATKLRINGVNTLQPTTPDPVIDDTLEIETLKNKAGYGVEKDKEYFNFWIHIAGYSNGAWKAWSTGKGEGEFIGYRYIVEWYDDNMNVIDTTFARIELANENNFNAMENFQEIETGTEKAYVASDEGIYKVKITRTRNAASISENSIPYRVTKAPELPNMEKYNYKGAVLIGVNELATDTEKDKKYLSVTMDEDTLFDQYEVIWKLWRGDKNKEDLEIATQFITERTANFSPALTAYASKFEAAGEDIEGRYYAIVSTIRNGVKTEEATAVPSPDNMFVVTGV